MLLFFFPDIVNHQLAFELSVRNSYFVNLFPYHMLVNLLHELSLCMQLPRKKKKVLYSI